MIQLNLSPEKQVALEQGAAAAGIDLATFVWDAVKDRLKERARPSLASAPYEVWQREFEAFIAEQKSHNPEFDDSRESIYD